MPEIRLALKTDLTEIWTLVNRAITHMHALGNPQWGEDYPTAAHYAADIERGELYVAIVNTAHINDAHASDAHTTDAHTTDAHTTDVSASIVGVACFNTDQPPEYAPLPWTIPEPAMTIHRMAVDPEAQRQGVASALFAFAEELARKQGIPTLHMDTYAQNERMQALVKGRGYLHVGEVSFSRPERPLAYPCFEKAL